LDAELTGLEASLKQEGATLDSALTDEAAAEKAFKEAEETNENAKAILQQLKEDQEAQEASQAETLSELKMTISDLESIAATFTENLANTLLFQ